MTIDVATAIARILKREGIEWVSTFPVCRVNNALGREGVPMVMMRDDRYAIALADAFSRVTGGDRIGVCTVQGGVNAAGIQVAYAGLAQAYEDGSPILCITDGVPAGSSENSQFDVTTSLKSVSKWYGYIDRPERVPEFMRRAFTMLRSGRPGPVVLSVPNAAGTYDESADPYTPVKGWKSAPDPADVSIAVDLLLDAENPLIYAGEGVIYAGASAELKALAELVSAPVITTLKAKGAFPEDHPLFVGVRGEPASEYMHKSDLILAIGSSLSPARFTHAIPDAVSKTIIQCNLDELHVNKIYPMSHAVLGDAGFTIRALTKEVSDRTGGAGRNANGVEAEIREVRDAGLAVYREAMASDEKPINPYRVYAGLMEALDPYNSFVTHDSRQYTRPTQHHLRHADSARLPGLGQRLYARIQPRRRYGREDSLPGKAVRRGDRRRRRGVYARQPGGSDAPGAGRDSRAYQQWRIRGIRSRILGRGTRSVHSPGSRPGRSGYVQAHRGNRAAHGAGD